MGKLDLVEQLRGRKGGNVIYITHGRKEASKGEHFLLPPETAEGGGGEFILSRGGRGVLRKWKASANTSRFRKREKEPILSSGKEDPSAEGEEKKKKEKKESGRMRNSILKKKGKGLGPLSIKRRGRKREKGKEDSIAFIRGLNTEEEGRVIPFSPQ